MNRLPNQLQMLYCGNNIRGISRLPNQLQMLYCDNNISDLSCLPTNLTILNCCSNESDKLRKQRNTEKTHLFLCLKFLQSNVVEQNSNFVEQADNFIPPLPNEMIMHIINFV